MTHLDLTNDSRCYTYYLKDNKYRLWKKAFDNYTSLSDYRSIVVGTIKPAQITKKKIEFIKNINEIDNKPQIYIYIKNSINRAENFTKD